MKSNYLFMTALLLGGIFSQVQAATVRGRSLASPTAKKAAIIPSTPSNPTTNKMTIPSNPITFMNVFSKFNIEDLEAFKTSLTQSIADIAKNDFVQYEKIPAIPNEEEDKGYYLKEKQQADPVSPATTSADLQNQVVTGQKANQPQQNNGNQPRTVIAAPVAPTPVAPPANIPPPPPALTEALKKVAAQKANQPQQKQSKESAVIPASTGINENALREKLNNLSQTKPAKAVTPAIVEKMIQKPVEALLGEEIKAKANKLKDPELVANRAMALNKLEEENEAALERGKESMREAALKAKPANPMTPVAPAPVVAPGAIPPPPAATPADLEKKLASQRANQPQQNAIQGAPVAPALVVAPPPPVPNNEVDLLNMPIVNYTPNKEMAKEAKELLDLVDPTAPNERRRTTIPNIQKELKENGFKVN